MERMMIGDFTFVMDKKNVVVVSDKAKKRLEKCLTRFKTSACVVRFDMAPWDGEGEILPIFEIDTCPDGLWAWKLLAHELPQEVMELADVALPPGIRWQGAYELLAEQTGWRIVSSWEEIPPGSRVYFTGGPDDIDEKLVTAKELTLVTDSFGTKTQLIEITGGLSVQLDKPPGLRISELTKQFPTGIVLKPMGKWGSQGIYPYPAGPQCAWMRGYAGVGKKFFRQVLRNGSEELVARLGKEWFIQPFFPPEPMLVGTRLQFRIWRIFAVRPSVDKRFKVLGGAWNLRPSLRVHGASNTTNGLIVFEENGRKPTLIESYTPRRKKGYSEITSWYM